MRKTVDDSRTPGKWERRHLPPRRRGGAAAVAVPIPNSHDLDATGASPLGHRLSSPIKSVISPESLFVSLPRFLYFLYSPRRSKHVPRRPFYYLGLSNYLGLSVYVELPIYFELSVYIGPSIYLRRPIYVE
ncbi:hypothetical protein CONPUDRAFT_158743 [Coniophora puteana RWD-64-598 SS2]|uniref:Uncharacterized protein n=1 Tax=Coniophora puteana (strain RWD-64-598) TaxID=741705 RepID=A0A5M3MAH2_CONPW|nr:uncharacterized protein CONPUDRAFT_158743 [Coniophora puteana RWD-64-598 SS2]EIW75966.1 hypothetical protein CONPUDRAFT_158743 [Coniophora puteana RWD-64-598 SS2]